MQTVYEATPDMLDAIRRLSREDAAALQRSLHQLDFDQFDFVCNVLEREVIDGRMSRREFRGFEKFFDRWWAHALPLKLAFLSRVVALSQYDDWPEDIFPTLARLARTPASTNRQAPCYQTVPT